MKLDKRKKQKVKNGMKDITKITLGFCLGAGVVGVMSALKLNKINVAYDDAKNDVNIFSIGCEFYKSKAEQLQHEIDIRDCMVMEGIDGDPDIFARRMQHFRDYKIQTTDIEQNEEDSEDYCKEYALDAEVTYHTYLDSLSKFRSEIPVITDDDTLPF